MDHYRMIYDPNGVPFEVVPERAADLVLNHGWSNTAPKTKTAKKAKSSAVKKDDTAPTADTEVTGDDPHESPDESG